MATIQDELCPDYVGDKRLTLNLSDPSAVLQAFTPIDVSVDYDDTEPQGIVLPLVLTIAAPTAANFLRRVYHRVAPSSFTFTPREGGRYVIRFGEFAHNRWYGTMILTVAGDRLSREA